MFAAKTSPRLTYLSQATETLRDTDKILLLEKRYGLVLVVLKPLNNLGVGVSRLSLLWQKTLNVDRCDLSYRGVTDCLVYSL